MFNLVTGTDSYKLCHHQQYPADTEFVHSYFESRAGAKFNGTLFFGLQYYLKKYLAGPVVTAEKIAFGKELALAHLGSASHFNEPMWNHILAKHGGRPPVRIRAVPEGLVIPTGNVLMSVQNTDPVCAPLTNHLETILSQVWAASTVATLSYEIYKMLEHYRGLTGDMNGLRFGLHDFGYRGCSSVEGAGVLGAGHLVTFLGTDTIRAMEVAHEYYDAPLQGLAYSVPATEHSVMTATGEAGEEALFVRLLKQYPTGVLSVVIDSYNYRRFVNEYGRKYKDLILARDGKVVFRPDSGDPTAVTLDVVTMLGDIFGTTINAKGYTELNPKVGVLWGDGIDYDGIRAILFALRNAGWSTNCIVFGMGGGLLQKINRDVQRFAFKASAQSRGGVWYDSFKKPLDMSKASKRGLLKLTCIDGVYKTVRVPYADFDKPQPDDIMRDVFVDGQLVNPLSFREVRANAGFSMAM